MINKIIDYIKSEDKLILFIYFYMLIMPWNFSNGQFGVLTIILFISWIIVFKKRTLRLSLEVLSFPPMLILYVFFIYVYITPFWSNSFSDGLEFINQYYKYFFLFIPVLFTTLNIQQAKIAIKILVISFCLYSIFSLLIFFGIFTVDDSTSVDPKGIMAYAITSQFMAIGTIASFIFAIFSNNKKSKMSFFLLSGVSFLALFVNNSRTAQIGFLLSVITILFIYYRKSIFKLKIFLSISFMFIITMVLVLAFLDNLGKLERYKKAVPLAQKALYEDYYSGSIGARIFFNKTGIEIFKDNIIFGTGPVDNREEHERIQKNTPNFNHHYVSHFHSHHLELLTAFGIIGYILFIYSIGYLIYKLKNHREYFFVGLSFYIPILYISLANGTFYKKPINYILISVFVLLSVIAYKKYFKESFNGD